MIRISLAGFELQVPEQTRPGRRVRLGQSCQLHHGGRRIILVALAVRTRVYWVQLLLMVVMRPPISAGYRSLTVKVPSDTSRPLPRIRCRFTAAQSTRPRMCIPGVVDAERFDR